MWVHFQDKYEMTKSTTISSESFCQSIYLLHHMHLIRIPNACWYLSVLELPLFYNRSVWHLYQNQETQMHHTGRIRLMAYLAAFCPAINKPRFTWLPNLENCRLYTNKKKLLEISIDWIIDKNKCYGVVNKHRWPHGLSKKSSTYHALK